MTKLLGDCIIEGLWRPDPRGGVPRRPSVSSICLNALGSTTFRQLLWQRASELDLTYAQSQVLFHVADHPGCHMGDVAKAFGVTLPAVTHIVDRLEEKQFVLRGRSIRAIAASTSWS